MNRISQYPGFWVSALTFGIVRARWIATTNQTLGRGGAGFWFAWFLLPFAQYGITGRLNAALAAAGSNHRESPLAVFLLSGWPLIGSKKRLRRAVERLNDVHQVKTLANA